MSGPSILVTLSLCADCARLSTARRSGVLLRADVLRRARAACGGLRDSIHSVALVVFCKLAGLRRATDLRLLFSCSASLSDVSRSLLEVRALLLACSGDRGGVLSTIYYTLAAVCYDDYGRVFVTGEVLPMCSPVSLLCGCTMATCLPPALPVSDNFVFSEGDKTHTYIQEANILIGVFQRILAYFSKKI